MSTFKISPIDYACPPLIYPRIPALLTNGNGKLACLSACLSLRLSVRLRTIVGYHVKRVRLPLPDACPRATGPRPQVSSPHGAPSAGKQEGADQLRLAALVFFCGL